MTDKNLVTAGAQAAANKGHKRSQAEINSENRARAARQAHFGTVAPAAEDMVTCRVLKAGDGKISMGQHFGGIGDAHYERGETFQCVRSTALELEDRFYVEIQDGPAEAAPAPEAAPAADAQSADA